MVNFEFRWIQLWQTEFFFLETIASSDEIYVRTLPLHQFGTLANTLIDINYHWDTATIDLTRSLQCAADQQIVFGETVPIFKWKDDFLKWITFQAKRLRNSGQHCWSWWQNFERFRTAQHFRSESNCWCKEMQSTICLNNKSTMVAAWKRCSGHPKPINLSADHNFKSPAYADHSILFR